MVLANTTSSCNGTRSLASILAGGCNNAGSCKRIMRYHINQGNSMEQSYFNAFGITRGHFGVPRNPMLRKYPYFPSLAYK